MRRLHRPVPLLENGRSHVPSTERISVALAVQLQCSLEELEKMLAQGGAERDRHRVSDLTRNLDL